MALWLPAEWIHFLGVGRSHGLKLPTGRWQERAILQQRQPGCDGAMVRYFFRETKIGFTAFAKGLKHGMFETCFSLVPPYLGKIMEDFCELTNICFFNIDGNFWRIHQFFNCCTFPCSKRLQGKKWNKDLVDVTYIYIYYIYTVHIMQYEFWMVHLLQLNMLPTKLWKWPTWYVFFNPLEVFENTRWFGDWNQCSYMICRYSGSGLLPFRT